MNILLNKNIHDDLILLDHFMIFRRDSNSYGDVVNVSIQCTHRPHFEWNELKIIALEI